MKKVVTAVLFCFLAGIVSADPIGFGVRGGVNMANQVSSYPSPSTLQTNDVVFGFTGGIFTEFELSELLSLQPEAIFSMKGYQSKLNHIAETNSGGSITGYLDGTFNFTFNYLEFPLFLKIRTQLAPGFKGSLSAGPTVGLLMSADENYSTGGFTGTHTLNGAGVEWSATFGAGIELDRFLLDLRYNLGLTSFYQNLTQGPTNSVLSLQVGYRIL